MINLQVIKELARARKIPLNDLADKVGMTNSAFHHMIGKNSTKIETLDKIAQVLNVPMQVFFQKTPLFGFDNGENENEIIDNILNRDENQEITDQLKDKIEILEKRTREIEEQLEDKKKVIKYLEIKYSSAIGAIHCALYDTGVSIADYLKNKKELTYDIMNLDTDQLNYGDDEKNWSNYLNDRIKKSQQTSNQTK